MWSGRPDSLGGIVKKLARKCKQNVQQ